MFSVSVVAPEQRDGVRFLSGGVPTAAGGVLVQVLRLLSSVSGGSVHAFRPHCEPSDRDGLSAQEGNSFTSIFTLFLCVFSLYFKVRLLMSLKYESCCVCVCVMCSNNVFQGFVSFLLPCFAVDHLYLSYDKYLLPEEETPIAEGKCRLI